MNGFAREVAVIVPLAPDEQAWRALLDDLKRAAIGVEIILVGPDAPAGFTAREPFGADEHPGARWLHAPLGRAIQLNAGAQATGREFLWFLHADTRLAPAAFQRLELSVARDPIALHYFDLRFSPDGPRLMPLNTAGVWLRSHLLGIPFGDQGLCLARETFLKLGGYCETAPYGEDHLLVWKARRSRVRLRCTGAALRTSARKYRERGWAATTLRHGWLTLRQALPEWVRGLRGPR